MKILVVDDEATMRIVAQYTIVKVAPECLIDYAVTERDAVALARAKKYDLILMDMILANDDRTGGIRAAGRIRVRGKSKNALIVGCSNMYDDVDYVTRAHKAGIDYFVKKPFSTDTIKRVFEEIENERKKSCCTT